MIKLSKLSTYTKAVRKNARTGNTELEALDVKKQNPKSAIDIPSNGYILKPNEIYIADVDDPSSERFHENYFRVDLEKLGVTCKILDDQCYITVLRPLRIYQDWGLFYEDEKE